MKTEPIYVGIKYELTFTHMLLSSTPRLVEVITEFREVVGSRYTMTPADIFTTSGQLLSDWSVGYQLFAGNGTYTLRLDSFTCEVRNIRTSEDAERARDSIVLAEEALQKAIQDISIREAKVTFSHFFKSDNEVELERAMRAAGLPSNPINPDALGASAIEYWPSGRLSNEDAGWSSEYRLQEARFQQARAFFYLQATYVNGSAYPNAETRLNHVSDLVTGLQTGMGLDSRGER